jgi:general secretion pathway protein K
MTRQVINRADYSIARAAAEAGLLHAEDRLVSRLREVDRMSFGAESVLDPWFDPARLVSDAPPVGDATCSIQLEDAGSRLDLNAAGEQELRRLMAAARVDGGDADRLAQAIMDWKDLDDLRRARGAEREEYVQADAPVLPANGPFGSVEELRQVMGMTEEAYRRMAPFLTVGGSGRINVSAAPSEVISALPGMSDDLLGLILRARARGGTVPDLLTLTSDLDEGARAAFQDNLPALLSRVTTSTQEVRVESTWSRPASSVRVLATATMVRAQGAVFVVDRSVR